MRVLYTYWGIIDSNIIGEVNNISVDKYVI